MNKSDKLARKINQRYTKLVKKFQKDLEHSIESMGPGVSVMQVEIGSLEVMIGGESWVLDAE
jgi:hypothetical protein